MEIQPEELSNKKERKDKKSNSKKERKSKNKKH